MLQIYGFARVNSGARNTRDLRVLWAVEEMGLPYEIWSGLMFLFCLAIGLALLLRQPGQGGAHTHSQLHSRL